MIWVPIVEIKDLNMIVLVSVWQIDAWDLQWMNKVLALFFAAKILFKGSAGLLGNVIRL